MKFLLLASSAFILPLAAAPGLGASSQVLTPSEAIHLAAETPSGVDGIFEFRVRRVEWADGYLFLGSEDDYRDQRCLSIKIAPEAIEDLLKVLGVQNVSGILHKTLQITGTAKRMKIRFVVSGKVTDKYYYQTHVFVNSADQIQAGALS